VLEIRIKKINKNYTNHQKIVTAFDAEGQLKKTQLFRKQSLLLEVRTQCKLV